MAFHKANAIFATPEKKNPGSGGIFSIFVSNLCKGCAACVTACGEHQALRMVQETEEVNAEHRAARRSSISFPTRHRNISASTTTRGRRIPKRPRFATC